MQKDLFLGVSIIVIGFCFFAPGYFTQKKSLIQRKGNIENVRTYYELVNGNRSFKSSLAITLKIDNKTYSIVENIGNDNINHRFENIKRILQKSKEVIIWIRKSEAEKTEPEVFQISESSGNVLFSIEEAKERYKYGLFVTFFFGILLICIHYLKDHVEISKTSKLYKTLAKFKLVLLRITGPLLAIFFGLLFRFFLLSEHSVNILTIFFGLLAVGFALGSLLFEIKLRK